jgi:hypothetical protein
MGGWHLRMTWGQEVCYASLHSEPASALGLLTVWSLWGNPGMARCWEMSTLPAGYIPQAKWHLWAAVGDWVFIVCVKCCTMVDSVPRWLRSLSWPMQSDHLSIADWMIPPLGRKHSHGKTQCIPGNQVLVNSWLWKIYLDYNSIRLSHFADVKIFPHARVEFSNHCNLQKSISDHCSYLAILGNLSNYLISV